MCDEINVRQKKKAVDPSGPSCSLSQIHTVKKRERSDLPVLYLASCRMPRSRPADVPAYLTFHEQHSLITRARPTGSLRGHPVSKIDLYRKRLGANRWWYDRGQLIILPWRMDGDSRLLIRYYGLNVRPQQYIYIYMYVHVYT